jgi:hypothetical protein
MIEYKEHVLEINQSELERYGVPYFLNQALGSEYWIAISVRLIHPEGLGGKFIIVALSYRYVVPTWEKIAELYIALEENEKAMFLKNIIPDEI